MNNKVGRPLTTIESLPEDWENIMITAAQEGASAVEIRCLLGIAQTAWTTLLNTSEQFRITERRCFDLCQVWWERQGRVMTVNGSGSSAVWKFNMQNRFSWRERVEQDIKADITAPSLIEFYAGQTKSEDE